MYKYTDLTGSEEPGEILALFEKDTHKNNIIFSG